MNIQDFKQLHSLKMNLFEPSDLTKQRNLKIIDEEDFKPDEEEDQKSEDEDRIINK